MVRLIIFSIQIGSTSKGRVFPRRLTHGGFLTIGYCFLFCFLEIFVGGDKALIEGNIVVMGDPPLGKTLKGNGFNFKRILIRRTIKSVA